MSRKRGLIDGQQKRHVVTTLRELYQENNELLLLQAFIYMLEAIDYEGNKSVIDEAKKRSLFLVRSGRYK